MEVSWSVYAERNDPYVAQNTNVRVMEFEKNPRKKGKYLHATAFGQPETKGNLPEIYGCALQNNTCRMQIVKA